MTTRTPAGPADIRRELGALDDEAIVRVAALEPTVEELVEARERLEAHDGLLRRVGPPSPRMRELLVVLAALDWDEAGA